MKTRKIPTRIAVRTAGTRRDTLPVLLAALAAALALCPMPGHAAETLLCSLSSIRSCDEASGCEPVLQEEINVPRFWTIDLENRKVSGVRPDGTTASSPIDSMHARMTRVSIQGVDNGRAWSATIGDDGSMNLVVSGEGFGFIAFGACTNP